MRRNHVKRSDLPPGFPMLRLSGKDGMRSVQDDGLAIFADTSRAVGPECADAVEPLFDHCSESSRSRVIRRPDLIGKSEIAEQRNGLFSPGSEASIGKPHKEVQNGWRCREDLHCIEVCNGLGFLDKNQSFLKWWAALKMKESQCHERARVTRPA